MEKKILRVSKREILLGTALLGGLGLLMLGAMFFESGFDLSLLLDSDVIIFGLIYVTVIVGYLGIYAYQYNNNILEYGNYGFVVQDKTYSYSQASKLVVGRRGRHGTFYHLYVGDEVIFKFSTVYENKDDFIEVLQKNGVLIVA